MHPDAVVPDMPRWPVLSGSPHRPRRSAVRPDARRWGVRRGSVCSQAHGSRGPTDRCRPTAGGPARRRATAARGPAHRCTTDARDALPVGTRSHLAGNAFGRDCGCDAPGADADRQVLPLPAGLAPNPPERQRLRRTNQGPAAWRLNPSARDRFQPCGALVSAALPGVRRRCAPPPPDRNDPAPSRQPGGVHPKALSWGCRRHARRCAPGRSTPPAPETTTRSGGRRGRAAGRRQRGSDDGVSRTFAEHLDQAWRILLTKRHPYVKARPQASQAARHRPRIGRRPGIRAAVRRQHECRHEACSPHSVLASPCHRPLRGSAPSAGLAVHGAQPIDG